MTITEYKKAVIALFQSGEATIEQWEEMASAVLYISEQGDCPAIDAVCGPECPEAGDDD